MTLEKIIKTHSIFKDRAWIILKKKDINIPFKYKNIEVCEYYYDDGTNPDQLTWIDVEGVGYGWMWMENWLRKRSTFLQRRAVKKYAKDILKEIDDEIDIVAFYYNNLFVCGFVPKDNPTIYIQIRLSNEDLYFEG